MTGYTSTSKTIKVANKFAVKDLKEGQVSVVYAKEFHGSKGLFELSADYTAYPTEDEVLVQDGLQFLITAKEYLAVDDKQICYIHLKYPANK